MPSDIEELFEDESTITRALQLAEDVEVPPSDADAEPTPDTEESDPGNSV